MKKILYIMLVCLVCSSCHLDIHDYLAPEAGVKTYSYTTETLLAKRGSLTIYGVLYRPIGVEGPRPVVILSHGFNGSHKNGEDYAEAFAQLGYICYSFDFCGAGCRSKSDGKTTDMSLLTERADLETVIDCLCEREDVDPSRISLAGDSQGGMVTALTAAHIPDRIESILLFYPALCIVDDAHRLWGTYENIPATSKRGTVTLGAVYYKDCWNIDVYSEIAKYKGPVLLVHGDKDEVVNLSYSERASEVYEDATFYIIHGGKHGFHGSARKQSLNYAIQFMSSRI